MIVINFEQAQFAIGVAENGARVFRIQDGNIAVQCMFDEAAVANIIAGLSSTGKIVPATPADIMKIR